MQKTCTVSVSEIAALLGLPKQAANATIKVDGSEVCFTWSEVCFREVANTSYSTQLMWVGPSPIRVVKAIRTLTGLPLKEAKDVIDSVRHEQGGKRPLVVEGVSYDRAREAWCMLQDAGAIAYIVSP